MQEYFLKYKDRDEAINDLKSKGILDEEGRQIEGNHFNEIGSNVIPTAYNELGEVIETSPDYHCNVYTENIIDFGNNMSNPKTPFRKLWRG